MQRNEATQTADAQVTRIGAQGAAVTTVVFDLDGTLLNGDSTGRWLRELLKRSPVRWMGALMIAAVACTMIVFPNLRRTGASMLVWVATFGMDRAALEASAETFVRRFQQGELPLGWRMGGVATLDQHLSAGHRVVVVTAAPEFLARALVQSFRPAVAVLGSSLKRNAGGWVGERHCRGEEKCVIMKEAGYPERWEFAYTDSDDDRPLLERSRRGFVVNPSARLRARLQKLGLVGIEHLQW